MTTQLTNLSDREHYLITKALAIAIGTIDRAAPRNQPTSDREGMRDLLETMVPNELVLEAVAKSVSWLFDGGLDLRRN